LIRCKYIRLSKED